MGTVFRNDMVLQDIAANDMNKKWNKDGDQAWMDKLADFSFTPENQAFNGIWVCDYEGISRVNLAISFLIDPDIVQKKGIGNARKNQLLSETYFLRAFYYFDLVNNFGDVPLVLKTPNSFKEAFAISVKVPVNEVRTQINLDLSTAKSVAENVKYSNSTEPWRVSKGAILLYKLKLPCIPKIGQRYLV